MRLSKFIKIVLVLISFLLIYQTLAFADTPPIPPCYFWGTVIVNGEYIIPGMQIYAKIGGVVVGESTTIEHEGEIMYGLLEIPGDISMQGELIEFFIDGQKAPQTAIWQSGVTNELNLSVWLNYLPLIVR
jgi:hypothetical protein